MVIKKTLALTVISIALLSMCAGCRTLPQPAAADKQVTHPLTAEPAAPQALVKTAQEKRPPESTVGTARYYANRFDGRKTASGEIFSQKKMTAAHPTLPFGTMVNIENLANSKSVIVRVNDRCRRHEKIFIDVSREAALELGFIRQGTATVRLIVLQDTPSSEVPAVAKD